MANRRGRAGLALMAAWLVLPVAAQDIEPRAYSNAPIGTNFLVAGYARTEGGWPLTRRSVLRCGAGFHLWRCAMVPIT